VLKNDNCYYAATTTPFHTGLLDCG